MFNLKELKTLITVVDEAGFEAAAKTLCLSTGAVSQRIRSIEDSIGKALLIRSSPPKLTPTGEQVIQFARQVQLLHNDMISTISEQTTNSKLAIAVNHDSLICWIMPIVNQLIQEYQVAIDIRSADNLSTQNLLKNGTVMGAVTAHKTQVSGCKIRELGALEYQVVCSKKFAKKYFQKGVDQTSLLTAPVMFYDREDHSLDSFLTEHKLSRNSLSKNYIPGSHELLNAVYHDSGWAAIPKLLLEKSINSDDLVVLNNQPIAVTLYWKTWDLSSQTMDLVTKMIVAKSKKYLAQSE